VPSCGDINRLMMMMITILGKVVKVENQVKKLYSLVHLDVCRLYLKKR
jgi:hypothetical protein